MIRVEPRDAPSRVWIFISPLIALLLSIVTGMVVFFFLGQPPVQTTILFFIAPVSDFYGLTELFLKMTPILLCALGLIFCFQAKIWNIGAEGQFVIGALAGGAVALNVDGTSTPLVVGLSLLAGIFAAAGWAAIAAWLKTAFSAHEILTTIMLNYIAIHLLTFLVQGPLRDPDGYSFPESALFPEVALLPTLFSGFRLTVATPLAFALAGLVWFVCSRFALAFRIRVLGADESAASFAGFSRTRLTWIVLLFSGAVAGAAGAAEVSGPVGQLTPHIAFGYGYVAIIVAFVGRLHPVGVVFASALMALTYLGGENLQLMADLPKSIASMYQGLLLLYVLGCDFAVNYRFVRQSPTQAPLVQ